VTGREGDGPGEFRGLNGLFPAAEGLVVWDGRLDRMTAYTASGELEGVVTLREAGAGVPAGYLPGVGLALASGIEPGTRRRIDVWDDAGEQARQLEGAAIGPGGLIRWTVDGVAHRSTSLPLACMAEPFQVVVDSSIVVGDPAAGVVTVVSAAGLSRELYRAPARAVVTESVRDSLRALLNRYVQSGGRGPSATIPPDTLDSALDRIGALGRPLPAWTAARADHAGRVWLELAICPGTEDAPRIFEIVDLADGYAGTISIPRELLLLAIRGDQVLVTRSDELGVERLELYRVEAADADIR